ncbi:DUF1036 domain-containing protein [Nostoc sp. FACHB-87]|uniref:DUF1036 domain-containing protein n=1 Tax=Nostocaceae TaxID=1162 RepID=UPI0016828DA9|nr:MULTISPECIES: DUF1036 domain-containing protein [Nostocaceae]MBD2456667.1 DUF1036 domain-containing protein [Nostoc sp. FACHB-87]MBD2478080.1 DUF1036 domain-containing protein [Anabaena sp. FACHB-83]
MVHSFSSFSGIVILTIVQNLYLFIQDTPIVTAQNIPKAGCITNAFGQQRCGYNCVQNAFGQMACADWPGGICNVNAFEDITCGPKAPSNWTLLYQNNQQAIDNCSQIQNIRRLAQQESLDLNTYSLNTLESKYCNKAISDSSITNSQGLKICNQTNVSVTTAIGYAENNKWYAEGWWKLSPRECARVYSSSLKNRYYYVYARSYGTSENLAWNGRSRFCVSNQAFKLSNSKTCEIKSEGFRKIDVGNNKEFTYNLTR